MNGKLLVVLVGSCLVMTMLPVKAATDEPSEPIPIDDTNNPPFASFTWDPPYPSAYETVTFIDLSQNAVEWYWNFGDGTTKLIKDTGSGTTTHVYEQNGTYYVTLTVYNAEGESDTETKSIYIDIQPELKFFGEPQVEVDVLNGKFYITVTVESAGGKINNGWAVRGYVEGYPYYDEQSFDGSGGHGQLHTAYLSVTIPSGPGTYTVCVDIDPYDSVTKQNENNNHWERDYTNQ